MAGRAGQQERSRLNGRPAQGPALSLTAWGGCCWSRAKSVSRPPRSSLIYGPPRTAGSRGRWLQRSQASPRAQDTALLSSPSPIRCSASPGGLICMTSGPRGTTAPALQRFRTPCGTVTVTVAASLTFGSCSTRPLLLSIQSVAALRTQRLAACGKIRGRLSCEDLIGVFVICDRIGSWRGEGEGVKLVYAFKITKRLEKSPFSSCLF